MFRKLDETTYVAGQIAPEDVAAARAEGITLIVNNRPEGEAPDQPAGAEIEAAARAVGLDYVAIPVTLAGLSAPQVEATGKALAGARGKTLAFCRSGTRSTLLWALARAHEGGDPEALRTAAAQAGYDVGPVRSLMDAFAAGRK